MTDIPFLRPAVPPFDEVRPALEGVWARGWFTNDGPEVRGLEADLAARWGRRVRAVSSGTDALLLALEALGVRGGEVVLPSFTFSATAHAVVRNGAVPVFADVDPATWCLDPAAAAAAIGPRTRAVVGVHIFGVPCDDAALSRLGPPVLYDACEAFGTTVGGRDVAAWGRASVFSFHATKIVPAIEGGAVATDDPEIDEAVRLARNFGNTGDYDCACAGMNAKLSEVHAVIGRRALAEAEALLADRRRILAAYRSALAGVPGLEPQAAPAGAEPNGQIVGVRVAGGRARRDRLRARLAAAGIETRAYFDPPCHRFKCYRDLPPRPLARTEALSAEILCLPAWAGLPDREIERIAAAIRAAA